MAIDFSASRWDKIKKDYTDWWEGRLDRPLVPVVVQGGHDPGRAKPAAPLLSQATCHDLSIPAEDVIDAIDYELSTWEYLGDAYPLWNMDCFGPGVMAAFLGGRLDNSTGRVWFHPHKDMPITDLHFEYDEDNPWLRRVIDIYSAGMKRWQGQVLMGMVDLGGAMDVLSTFRPAEKLLYDLYDYPEEVERLERELYDLWIKVYDRINDVLQPVNPGYSDWAKIYCAQPTYVLQCDFCYMIGPKMFDQFVLKRLEDACRYLPYSMYHLDGPGQLVHLDRLLGIPELDAVQWVPGAGQKPLNEWGEVYRKVADAGKKIQLMDDGSLDSLGWLIEFLGSGRGVHRQYLFAGPGQREELARKLIAYGAQ